MPPNGRRPLALLGFCLLVLGLVACPGAPPPARPRPAPAPSPTPAPALDARAELVDNLAALRFDRLGNPVLRWDHVPPVQAPRDRPHRLLVVLVDFPDRRFLRFAGEPDQGERLAAHFQELLFDESFARYGTLSHYYATQSLGAYHLTGTVLPPVTLDKPRAAYGAPVRPAGGNWRHDADSEGLVEEAMRRVGETYPDTPWADFDRWDPQDFDGDGVRDEPDGYLDHFVIVYAGGGQAACHALYQLDDVLTPNAGPEALATLGTRERECADRLWPHRFMVQRREGRGPVVDDRLHRRGGAPVREGLWVRDYNMQSELTELSTFAHEFGHSLGLPDVYARSSSNSTGPWELMSANAADGPQSLSAWSRMQLGWLKPRVILPPAHGGEASVELHLRTLDEPGDGAGERAALVVLPPKTITVDLGGLPPASGRRALYSGQGNDMQRSAELSLDLRRANPAELELSFDAWWKIEAGWDFAYLETSVDDGATWVRRVPVDRRHMPAKHGHDGDSTLPGFTGLSGDLDGDEKNESHPACDPKQELSHGEDKAGQTRSPCAEPTWVRPAFDLSDLAGHEARVRLRYFTDMAAVLSGILIDNVTLTGAGLQDDFETGLDPRWRFDGFSFSTGRHEVLVPHYYLLEHRDPYATAGGETARRYDQELGTTTLRFFHDPEASRMLALRVRPRPGVVLWYFDGSYAWSENDPADNGPGRGFLLAVDAHPDEIALPGLTRWLQGSAATGDSRYELDAPAAQAALRRSWTETVCFVRNPPYLPRDLAALADRTPPAGCGRGDAPLGRLAGAEGRLVFSYQYQNELLPGPARAAWREAGELVDIKRRKSDVVYRLRDRTLRYLHTLDAPFAPAPFEAGVTLYEVRDGKLHELETRPHPAQAGFSDASPRRWLNPRLPFGGVDVPGHGLGFEVTTPPAGASGSRIALRWER